MNYVSKPFHECDCDASLGARKKKQLLGASAESRSLTLRQRKNLALEFAQLHGSQWGDLRRGLDVQHAAIAGRRPLVFAVSKAAGPGGDCRRWRCWCSPAGCDDIVQLNTAGACLVRMDQVERHGDLAVHLLAAPSRSRVPIDHNGISETSPMLLHRGLPLMEVGWAVDEIAMARDSTRRESRWLG